MKRGILNKKITILKTTYEINEMGDSIPTDTPLYSNIWAYYKYLRGDEQAKAHGDESKEEALFIIRWTPQIDSFMTILYKDDKYNIKEIDDYEGRKKYLSIRAEKVSI